MPQQQPGADSDGMQGAPQAQPGQPPQGPNPAADGMQPQPGMGTFGANQQTDPQAQIENYIDFALTENNLAKKFRNKKEKDGTELLVKMGAELVQAYEEDEQSRSDWLKQNQEWIKLAMLTRENKTYPWPKASNIKYPLLSTAAMQFSARAYPALVPSTGKIVGTKVVQKDPDDQTYAAAERVSQHMSWQLMNRIPNWEQDMDKLLMTIAISGLCFKKTYYDSVAKCHHSHIVYPENLCVNYYAKNLHKAYRKTEILYYTENDIQAKKNNNEEFLEVDLPSPESLAPVDEKKKPLDGMHTSPPPVRLHPMYSWRCIPSGIWTRMDTKNPM